MPKVTPFKSVRPAPALVSRIAALPYDVYNRREALEIVKKNPYPSWQSTERKPSFPMT
jgi:uncharacterized protein (DUF1015 family)